MFKSRKFVAFVLAMVIGLYVFTVTLIRLPSAIEKNIQFFLLYFGTCITAFSGFKALEVSAQPKIQNNNEEGK
jgi:cytochrome c biogenesis protein CcdA